MSKRKTEFRPPSLTQLFDPPEGYTGYFGWVCGFSADAVFMNMAAERFTGNTKAQRAYQGKISLALMLDPGNPQLSPGSVPGIMHLPIKSISAKPFRFMHAKVALLGYKSNGDNTSWTVRLIVSTGNWTRETLEESLDLFWPVDICSDNLKEQDDGTRQIRADIVAVRHLFSWLRKVYNCDILQAVPSGRMDTDTTSACRTMDEWLMAITKPQGVMPRFFDNRLVSLCAQLPALVKEHAGATRRNYLCLGSGFYEGNPEKGKVPKVIKKVIDTLYESGLRTKTSWVNIRVNKEACQGIATTLDGILKNDGWSVSPPVIPQYLHSENPRKLHAKFLFGANCIDKNPKINSPWYYLGSGNMTGPGFISKMSGSSGNLEAGIVDGTRILYWTGKKNEPCEIVTNLLPIAWESEEIEESSELSAGKRMTERNELFVAAPIPYLIWNENPQKVTALVASTDVPDDTVILNESNLPVKRKDARTFIWSGQQPRQVVAQWPKEDDSLLTSIVPVIDEFGRIAGTELPPIDIDDVWGQLETFPLPPNDDELPPDDDTEPIPPSPLEGQPGKATHSSHSVYPIRTMMELVENIALKQTGIQQDDWSAWCNRLEQCLVQVAEHPVVSEFHELKLNPVSPLWNVAFRPEFAESSDTTEGERYETVLRNVEKKWLVSTLERIGG